MAALLLLAAVAAAPPPAGLSLGLAVPGRVLWQDAVPVTFTVGNQGARPAVVPTYGNYELVFGQRLVRLEVFELRRGGKVPVPASRPVVTLKEPLNLAPRRLAPAQSLAVTLDALAFTPMRSLAPGRYELVAVWDVAPSVKPAELAAELRAEVRSAPQPLEVLAESDPGPLSLRLSVSPRRVPGRAAPASAVRFSNTGAAPLQLPAPGSALALLTAGVDVERLEADGLRWRASWQQPVSSSDLPDLQVATLAPGQTLTQPGALDGLLEWGLDPRLAPGLYQLRATWDLRPLTRLIGEARTRALVPGRVRSPPVRLSVVADASAPPTLDELVWTSDRIVLAEARAGAKLEVQQVLFGDAAGPASFAAPPGLLPSGVRVWFTLRNEEPGAAWALVSSLPATEWAAVEAAIERLHGPR